MIEEEYKPYVGADIPVRANYAGNIPVAVPINTGQFYLIQSINTAVPIKFQARHQSCLYGIRFVFFKHKKIALKIYFLFGQQTSIFCGNMDVVIIVGTDMDVRANYNTGFFIR